MCNENIPTKINSHTTFIFSLHGHWWAECQLLDQYKSVCEYEECKMQKKRTSILYEFWIDNSMAHKICKSPFRMHQMKWAAEEGWRKDMPQMVVNSS